MSTLNLSVPHQYHRPAFTNMVYTALLLSARALPRLCSRCHRKPALLLERGHRARPLAQPNLRHHKHLQQQTHRHDATLQHHTRPPLHAKLGQASHLELPYHHHHRHYTTTITAIAAAATAAAAAGHRFSSWYEVEAMMDAWSVGRLRHDQQACGCPIPTPAQDCRPSSIAYLLLASAASSSFF